MKICSPTVARRLLGAVGLLAVSCAGKVQSRATAEGGGHAGASVADSRDGSKEGHGGRQPTVGTPTDAAAPSIPTTQLDAGLRQAARDLCVGIRFDSPCSALATPDGSLNGWKLIGTRAMHGDGIHAIELQKVDETTGDSTYEAVAISDCGRPLTARKSANAVVGWRLASAAAHADTRAAIVACSGRGFDCGTELHMNGKLVLDLEGALPLAPNAIGMLKDPNRDWRHAIGVAPNGWVIAVSGPSGTRSSTLPAPQPLIERWVKPDGTVMSLSERGGDAALIDAVALEDGGVALVLSTLGNGSPGGRYVELQGADFNVKATWTAPPEVTLDGLAPYGHWLGLFGKTTASGTAQAWLAVIDADTAEQRWTRTLDDPATSVFGVGFGPNDSFYAATFAEATGITVLTFHGAGDAIESATTRFALPSDRRFESDEADFAVSPNGRELVTSGTLMAMCTGL